jgi:glycosyltransferase involved in cell wall biosynthesis
MKILQICKKFPFPLKDGESIAVTNLSKALKGCGAEVSLLAMNTARHYYKMDAIPVELAHYNNIWTVDIDNRIKVIDALKNLFSSASYHIERFHSEAFVEQLTSILQHEDFDVIQLETLYLTPYIDCIRQNSTAKIVLRSHNVEFEIWERLYGNQKNILQRAYLKYLTGKLRKFEIRQLSLVDAIVAITERDLEFYRKLGYRKEGISLPIGLDLSDYNHDFQSFDKPLSLSFIGSLDWQPNMEGLLWFLDGPWKLLESTYKNLTFHIAGRNMPQVLQKYRSDKVILHGEVPDAATFISEHSIMVVPLLSGGGMRAKILEGMALGKIVISTPIGIEGIPAVNGEHAFITRTAEEFKSAIQYCFTQNGELKAMGKNAREFIGQNYDNVQLADQLLSFYEKIGKKLHNRKEAEPVLQS